MDIKDIYRLVRPLKDRMHINNAIFCVMVGISTAGALSLLLSYGALFVPVPYLLRILAVILAACIFVSLLVSLFLRPKNLKVMKTADSLGLKERLITAYQFKEDASPISRIQRYDTLKALTNTDFRRSYPLRFPSALGIACIALALLVGLSFMIPSRSRETARQLEKLFDEIKKQAEKLDKDRKEANKKTGLADENLKDINAKIDQLLKELQKSKSEGEAVKALSRAKHELEELKQKSESSDLGKLAENLMKNPVTKDIGQSIKNGSMSDMKQKLEQMNNELKKMDEASRKDLAESFKKMAEQVAKDKQLAQNLLDLGNALSSGNLNSLASQASALNETLSRLAASDPELASAMEQLNNQVISQLTDSISDARSQISRQSGGSSQQAQNQQQGNTPSQGGNQQGEGGQQNSPPGQGNSGGNGEGNGQGNGGSQGNKGAGGAGMGTTNKDMGYGGEESSGGGRTPGKKEVKDYESIYVPERLGGNGNESQVKGTKGNSGESSWAQSQNSPVEKGSALPYDRVLGDYRSEAMSSVDNSSIPPVMKDIVRDYFSSLE